MSYRSHPTKTATPNGNRNNLRPATPNNHAYPRPFSRTGSSTTLPNPADFDHLSDDEMTSRPPLHKAISHTPLLSKDGDVDDEERGRSYSSPDPSIIERPPLFTRRSAMRSRSPDTQAKLATKKKYTYAALFLGLSLVSFVVQTETAVYIQHSLGWDKAYCMLYVPKFWARDQANAILH